MSHETDCCILGSAVVVIPVHVLGMYVSIALEIGIMIRVPSSGGRAGLFRLLFGRPYSLHAKEDLNPLPYYEIPPPNPE